MPTFFTPDHPPFTMPDLKEVVENEGYKIDAHTLGELLVSFERITGCRVIPHDPPKYFRYYRKGETDSFLLVDIHVTRGGSEVCPKQDLDFRLEQEDIVEAGVLIC